MDGWPELGSAWAAWQRQHGLAGGTILKRRYELAMWATWIGTRWTTATWRDVEAWIASRVRLGPRAQASTISHLRAFYRWARREGLCDIDPCADVIAPRGGSRLPRPARAAAVERAVGAGVERLEVACALMAFAGLRCCEVARLRWDDVDLAAGVIYVDAGKGDRDGTVPIVAPLRAVLSLQHATDGPVVPNVYGRATTPARMSQVVNAHLRRRRCGCTAHQLRHYFGTRFLELAGGDLLAVREVLRHASITTTQVYAQLAPGTVADIAARW